MEFVDYLGSDCEDEKDTRKGRDKSVRRKSSVPTHNTPKTNTKKGKRFMMDRTC